MKDENTWTMPQILQSPTPGTEDKFWSKMLSSVNHDMKIKSHLKFAPLMADQNDIITMRAVNLRPAMVKKNSFGNHHSKFDEFYMGKYGLPDNNPPKIRLKTKSPAHNFKSTNLLVTGTLAPELTQKPPNKI